MGKVVTAAALQGVVFSDGRAPPSTARAPAASTT